MNNVIKTSLLLSLLSLFFLTGCKDDINENADGIKKNYIYARRDKVTDTDTYRYRAVYPLIVRFKADGKLMTEEKKFERFFNDTGYVYTDRFYVSAASSGMDLEAEIEILDGRGAIPSSMIMIGFYDVRIADDFHFHNGEKCEGDFGIVNIVAGNTYKNNYCQAEVKLDNLTVRLDKVQPEDLIKTRIFRTRFFLTPSEVYERTPEGERQIDVGKKIKELYWCTSLYFAMYSFGKEVTSNNWPTHTHYGNYY